MKKMLNNLFYEESGQALVEYGLILGLVSIVAVSSLTSIGNNLEKIYDKIAIKLVNTASKVKS